MDVYCTRPGCPRPVNRFADLDNNATLKTVQQKFCVTCGMPLLLLGRYIPTKLLGQGGFGAAFLARDRFTPAMRQCVVKLFQPSASLTPAQLKVAQDLFEREGEVLEILGNRHPEIPDLLAFFELDVPSNVPGKSDKYFYLVQEFIDGHNLEDELAKKGSYSEAEITEILTAVLKILKFVHDNGSIHRDIKPSNIMRHRDGRIYVLDFGAVKQVTSTAATSGSGKASTGIYSMGFAPPEQMSGNTVFPATDLYALGVTCITLLTGKQPNELFDPYSNSWNWRAYAAVSDRLEAILNQMLLPSPSQRFQSADEVLSALVSSPVSSSPSPAPAPSPAPSPRASKPAPAPKPAPPPSPPPTVAPVPPPPPVPAAAQPSFSLFQIIRGAAFTGFEGGLLAIALLSLLGTTAVTGGFWLLLLAGLILAQNQRWIEKTEMLLLVPLTLALVIFFAPLRDWAVLQIVGNPIQAIILLAGLGALVAIAITLIFQLVYRILSRLF